MSVEARLLDAKQKRIDASIAYQHAVKDAVDAGWANSRIANVLGVSEAAVRMYVKRKKLREEKARGQSG